MYKIQIGKKRKPKRSRWNGNKSALMQAGVKTSIPFVATFLKMSSSHPDMEVVKFEFQTNKNKEEVK